MQRKWKAIPCSWTGRINIFKCIYYPKLHRFGEIPIKTPKTFSTTLLKKSILTIIWNTKQFKKKKNKTGDITLPDINIRHL